jgi:hypothetical protein
MMNQRIEASNEMPHTVASELPPLRIHHLLAMTAVTAAVIVGPMAFDRLVRNAEPIDNPVIVGCLVLVALALAIALVTAGFGLYWRMQGERFPTTAGWKFAVLLACAVGGHAAALLVSLGIFNLNHDWFPAAWVGLRVLLVLGISVYCVRCAKAPDEQRRWKVAFVAVAALPVSVGTVGVTIAMFITAALVAWAILQDVSRTVDRHWTHWAGAVAVAVVLAAAGTISLYPFEEHWQVSGYLR